MSSGGPGNLAAGQRIARGRRPEPSEFAETTSFGIFRGKTSTCRRCAQQKEIQNERRQRLPIVKESEGGWKEARSGNTFSGSLQPRNAETWQVGSLQWYRTTGFRLAKRSTGETLCWLAWDTETTSAHSGGSPPRWTASRPSLESSPSASIGHLGGHPVYTGLTPTSHA